jgi:hypothetical protein
LQDRDRVKKRGTHIREEDRVHSDIRLKDNGGEAMQLLALGTGEWIMGRVVFLCLQMEIKRDVTPRYNDKQNK